MTDDRASSLAIARTITNRDHRGVLLAAIDRGWQITRSRSGHLRLTHPTGAVEISATTTTRSGTRNLDAELRRHERRTPDVEPVPCETCWLTVTPPATMCDECQAFYAD